MQCDNGLHRAFCNQRSNNSAKWVRSRAIDMVSIYMYRCNFIIFTIMLETFESKDTRFMLTILIPIAKCSIK